MGFIYVRPRRFNNSRRRRPARRTNRGRTSFPGRTVAAYRVPRSVGSFRGEYIIRKLKYIGDSGAAFQLNSTSGALATDLTFRANDLRDPNEGGVGGQPRQFDELMALYRNFVVLGSKITLDCSYGTGSSTSNDILVSCILKDGTTAMASAKDVMEHPRNKYIILSAENDRKRLVHKYSWKILGNQAPLDNQNAWGSSGGSPVEQFYYHINAYAPNGTNETASIVLMVEYTAVFFHAIQPSAS